VGSAAILLILGLIAYLLRAKTARSWPLEAEVENRSTSAS